MTLNYSQKNLLPKDVKMLCNCLIEWLRKSQRGNCNSYLKIQTQSPRKNGGLAKSHQPATELCPVKVERYPKDCLLQWSPELYQAARSGGGMWLSRWGCVFPKLFTFTPHLLPSPE